MVERLGCTRKAAELLVKVGLWETAEDGYVFHDYLQWNLSRDQVQAKRAATRARLAKARTGRVTNASCNASPIPSHPIQDPPEPPEGTGTLGERASQAVSVSPELLLEAFATEAAARGLAPAPTLSRSQAAAGAKRASTLVGTHGISTPERAAQALAHAAFQLHVTTGRPIGFALAEATLFGPNGKSEAQAAHVPPTDKFV